MSKYKYKITYDTNPPPIMGRGRPPADKWETFLSELDNLRKATGWSSVLLPDSESMQYARLKARKAGFSTVLDPDNARLLYVRARKEK